ncbi:Copine-3 [Phytophthora fragariae]|uniref:Copine-3 n=1 Tax=Phytophthora fragariae TaxID=53985 RepID=A0A6A3YC11_9STRA|nr:Copine-3 [Phytophthora fragariae]KAE9216106.1 Copine-3 [Phytophthora fragariae]KAE9237885.1 Copine-3 [Phytophthora fragariae]KAE9313425.1 Copine-3 [Phytophthora fragariae]
MYASGMPPPGAVRPPTSSVELSLSAKDLKDRDIISKSDPFAVLYVKSGAGWTQLGKTEVKKDDLNPKWAKLFLVEFHFESVQQLKVEVYDQDSSSPDKLKEQDHIGGAEFTLGQLMGAPGQSGSFLLTRGKSKSKHQGSLLVRAEEVKASNEAARLRFSATALANMDGLFSKSDPFLVISRLREDGGSWTQVHRTETIDNNLNPNWRRFELPLQQLCNGDHRRPLRLEVFDEDRGGKFELIGQVQTTLEEILGKRGTNYTLHNETLQKKKGKKYTNAGLLVVAEVELYREHSFIDYLSGGLEMNLIIGIDYTASNGPPNDPRSLHFIDPRGPNQYQHAISSTVSILQEYDADKQFPVYGFGGIPPGAYDVDHCFPLNLNPSNPEVAGSQGVLQLYTASLGHVRLHGPTFFAPLINQSMRIANQLNDPRKQKYFVLLIITDGAIMDMQGTIDAVVEASHTSPLSIVVIGVGPADFSSMVALDGDGGKLRASNGRVSARDIVQFVPYNRFAGYPDALTRETLAELPRQLCQYMKGLSQLHHLQPLILPLLRPLRQPSSNILFKVSSSNLPQASTLRDMVLHRSSSSNNNPPQANTLRHTVRHLSSSNLPQVNMLRHTVHHLPKGINSILLKVSTSKLPKVSTVRGTVLHHSKATSSIHHSKAIRKVTSRDHPKLISPKQAFPNKDTLKAHPKVRPLGTQATVIDCESPTCSGGDNWAPFFSSSGQIEF